MFANYHTHTIRCKHAQGTEREYIEEAIKAGYKVLGFSDHGTYIVDDDFVYRVRMLPNEVSEYIDTLKALREEYKNDIEIHIGFELEYYPSHFDKTIEFLKQFDYEYLILGQHYTDDGKERSHVMKKGNGDDVLERYVEQVVAGIKTGRFSYVAHPDVLNYEGSDENYAAQMRKICVAAKEMDIPLELNCLGVRSERCYPNEKFWEIASEVGNSVIIGLDAHEADVFSIKKDVERCEEIAAKYNLKPLDTLKLIDPKF